MTDFRPFSVVVTKAFQAMATENMLFVANVNGDTLYEQYLRAFPPGTNNLFMTKTQHECSCCRHFIRRIGNVISLKAGSVTTVWDKAAETAAYPYGEVACALRDLVKSAGVADIFVTSRNEVRFGSEKTASISKMGTTRNWYHFDSKVVPVAHVISRPDERRGAFRTTVQVFERGLEELQPSALEQILALVDANNLYRGAEHRAAVAAFQALQVRYRGLTGLAKNLFVWENVNSPAARFRNTVIGTLAHDLSHGEDIEEAVQAFETKVAPQNYKRTTAIVTPAMVAKAAATIEQLGLEPALERRFAKIGDISVRDVLWIDGSVKPLTKDGLMSQIMSHVVEKTARAEPSTVDTEKVTLDTFISTILPEATELELFFSNDHVSRLVSLTAPVHPEPRQLFRWENDFAWSYRGGVADSIKERVKKAGGRTDGALRVSLSWYNYDDLDLHIKQPNGYTIFYGNKVGQSGGKLDVDMNVSPTTREPVENVIWPSIRMDGVYQVVVNNFNKRETNDVGFAVEIEHGGKLATYVHEKSLPSKQQVTVALITIENRAVVDVTATANVVKKAVTTSAWGLETGGYVKVDAVSFSPNYWGDNAYGNKHVFFFLNGCLNDEPTRGIYNEFLHARLEPHRKVFELIGERTKCQPTPGQLSGLGFSLTQQVSFLARVKQGKRQRHFEVKVGA